MTKDEEYCEECDKQIDDCECEEGPTLTEILDGAKKVLDIAKTYKELTQPNSPKEIMGRVEAERAGNYMREEFERNQRTSQRESQKQSEKDNKDHRKWKVSLAVAIVVPITVAIIGGIFYLISI